jgi:hypothetical protein
MSNRYHGVRRACAAIVLFSRGTLAEEMSLPSGNAPAPVVSRHFPDRVHEFVWRNWNAVEPGKLAEVLGASVGEVTSIAESMGLPCEPTVPPGNKGGKNEGNKGEMGK